MVLDDPEDPVFVELAAFAENGPFEVVENENAAEEDRYVLKETQYGWDTVGHLLYVDQPGERI